MHFLTSNNHLLIISIVAGLRTKTLYLYSKFFDCVLVFIVHNYVIRLQSTGYYNSLYSNNVVSLLENSKYQNLNTFTKVFIQIN